MCVCLCVTVRQLKTLNNVSMQYVTNVHPLNSRPAPVHDYWLIYLFPPPRELCWHGQMKLLNSANARFEINVHNITIILIMVLLLRRKFGHKCIRHFNTKIINIHNVTVQICHVDVTTGHSPVNLSMRAKWLRHCQSVKKCINSVKSHERG